MKASPSVWTGRVLSGLFALFMLGVVLLMGLFGGAMATQIRVGSPLFSHTLFSIYLALFMWGGLWLRSPELRALFPISTSTDGRNRHA